MFSSNIFFSVISVHIIFFHRNIFELILPKTLFLKIIGRNFYEGKKQQPYALPTVSAKNLKEKFAKLFLTEIQKNLSPKVSSSILPILKKKEKWRKLYKELHFLAKSEMLTQQNFHNKHYADLKEAKKSINLFSPTTRSFNLAFWLKKVKFFMSFKIYLLVFKLVFQKTKKLL